MIRLSQNGWRMGDGEEKAMAARGWNDRRNFTSEIECSEGESIAVRVEGDKEKRVEG